MASRMNFNPSALPIATVMNQIKNVNKNGLDLQPPYQRGYVWNEDFKEKLIYSIIKGYPIGNISVRNLEEANEKKAKSEVVDGQQRLTTIFNFINDDLEIKGEFARKIIEEIKDYLDIENDKKALKLIKKLDRKGKPVITYNDLPEDIHTNIQSYPLSMTNISNATSEQITEYFNFLQNQERLRAGEIINSLPETYLEKYLNKIEDRDNLVGILSFEDNRKEFEKIFYSIIGLFDQKINLGVTDKVIQDYVSSKSEDLLDKTLILTNNMIENLNFIVRNVDEGTVRANKRYIKLLLLLCGFNLVNFKMDTKEKLVKLETINNKLSAFNSAKKGIVEETFIGYEKDDIEKYRLIALLTKGSQPFDRVEDRLQILSNYINF